MKIRWLLPGLMMISSLPVQAQKKGDTLELIKEFNKVMSFSVQPYLYYTSLTSVFSTPPVSATDTATLVHGRFYKVKDDLYYGNEREETFLQDSLLIQISHTRKTIQLNRVDTTSKAKLDIMPLQKANMQKLLRDHYTVSQAPGSGDSMEFFIRQQSQPGLLSTTTFQLFYTKTNGLPYEMKMIVSSRQRTSEEVISSLAAQGVNTGKLVQTLDGVPYLVFSQTADIRFTGVELGKEKAEGIPQWKDEINYDESEHTFVGKGICEGYEVIQAF